MKAIRIFLLIITTIIIVFFSLFYIGSQEQLIETLKNNKITFLLGRLLLNYIAMIPYFLILLLINLISKDSSLKKYFKTDFIILNLISLITIISIYWFKII